MGINLTRNTARDTITKTEGYWVYTNNGERHLDLMGGGMTYPLGYGNKEISDAVYNSLLTVSRCHVRMGYTMPLIEEMGDFLCKSGGWASYCWTVTGTSAVECAIYMADMYWDKLGQNKPGIISFSIGWNGTSYLTKTMSGLFPTNDTRVHLVDTPTFRVYDDQSHEEERTINDIIKIIKNNADIGSIVINPAPWFNGVHIWSFNFWRTIRKICDDNKILLILDDVASCWGKSKAFHSHDTILPSDIRSDISCLGKALTGGYAPLAATVANKKVTDVINGNFGYGHTFQPLVSGVAAMKATTDIIKRDNLLEYSQVIEDRLKVIFQEFVDNGDAISYNAFGLQGILYLKKKIPRNKYADRYYGRSYDESIYPNIRICSFLTADEEYFYELKKLMKEMII